MISFIKQLRYVTPSCHLCNLVLLPNATRVKTISLFIYFWSQGKLTWNLATLTGSTPVLTTVVNYNISTTFSHFYKQNTSYRVHRPCPVFQVVRTNMLTGLGRSSLLALAVQTSMRSKLSSYLYVLFLLIFLLCLNKQQTQDISQIFKTLSRLGGQLCSAKCDFGDFGATFLKMAGVDPGFEKGGFDIIASCNVKTT